MKTPAPPQGIPRLVSVTSLAHAWETSPATVRRWAREANLPAVKIGKEWRFDVDELRRFVAGAAK